MCHAAMIITLCIFYVIFYSISLSKLHAILLVFHFAVCTEFVNFLTKPAFKPERKTGFVISFE